MKPIQKQLVPIAGLAGVAVLGLFLVLQVVWRPWSGPNTSWRTHLNLEAASVAGYTRTSEAYVGERGPLDAWQPAFTEAADGEGQAAGYVPGPPEEGRSLFISKGCASCHGLDAQGAVFGASLPGHTIKKVQAGVRQPLGRMPAFPPEDLSDGELEKIAAYIAGLSSGHEEPAAVVLDKEQIAALSAILDALKAGNIPEATGRLGELMSTTADHDLKHALEDLMGKMAEGEMHDAEHALGAMLESGPGAEPGTMQSHLRLALQALEDRDLAAVPEHVRQFIAMSSGMDRMKGEHVLELLEADEYHDASHEMEGLLGMPAREGH